MTKDELRDTISSEISKKRKVWIRIFLSCLLVISILFSVVLILIIDNYKSERHQRLILLSKYSEIVSSQNEKIIEKKEIISKLKPKPIKVTVTCYNPDPKQTDSTPDIGAFNNKVKPGGLAISRDLFESGYVPGMKVYLMGVGVFKINDVMNKRWEKRVDIFTLNNTDIFKHEDILLSPIIDEIL